MRLIPSQGVTGSYARGGRDSLPPSPSAICTDDEAELAAIDENLVRAELTPAQRTEATTRRRELWERVRQAGNPVGQVVPLEIGYGKPPPRPREFAAETAELTGESKRDVNRHLSRGEALKDVLPRIGPENGATLHHFCRAQ